MKTKTRQLIVKDGKDSWLIEINKTFDLFNFIDNFKGSLEILVIPKEIKCLGKSKKRK